MVSAHGSTAQWLMIGKQFGGGPVRWYRRRCRNLSAGGAETKGGILRRQAETRERETRKLPPFAPIRGYAQIATGISSPSTSGGEENETASPLTSRLATTSAASASTQSSRPTSLGKGMSITCGAVPASQPECAALLRPPTVTGRKSTTSP